MGWITTAPLLLATCLFVLQGVSFLSRSPRTAVATSAGRLTLLLAACGLGTFLLLTGGWLVVSPEYSIIMVQGRVARFGMALLIFTLSVAAGLALHVVRSSLSPTRPSRQAWLLLFGALVGLISVLRMPAINLADPEPLHVFVYDLWWPALLLWVALCISEAATVLLDISDRLTRLWVALLLPFLLANFAVHRAQAGRWYADARSLSIWYFILVLTAIGSLGLGTWLFVKSKNDQGKSREPQRTVAGIILAIVGGASSGAWIAKKTVLQWPLRPWFVWTVWLAMLLLLCLPRVVRMWRSEVGNVPRVLRPRLVPDFLILLALAGLVSGLADLFHYGSVDPVWDLAGLIVVFVTIVELLGGAPLRSIVERPWLKAILAAEAPVIELLRSIWKGFNVLTSAAKNIFVRPTLSGIVKVILALIALSIIAEIPNRGKTVVQSFQPLGFADKDDSAKDVGHLISSRVVNTLGLLRQELKPSMVTLSTPGSQKAEIRTLDTGEDTNNLQASVKGDLSVPGIPGLSVPLNWITDQLQAPFNLLFSVRVVRGTVQPNSEGGLLVLAGSSRGETWLAPSPPTSLLSTSTAPANGGADNAKASVGLTNSPAPPANPAAPAKINDEKGTPALGQSAATPVSATQPSNATSLTQGDPPNRRPTSCSVLPSPSRSQSGGTPAQIADTGDEIAYKVAASDPNLIDAGMTTSWQAIPCFRDGLKSWNDYNVSREPADLNNAISMFRQAINVDQKFPWAHYYLGLALREDGQPGLAVAEFRYCLQSSPAFYRAAKALAETLYFFDDFYPPSPAELTSGLTADQDSDGEPAGQSRVREAKQWLQQMVKSPSWQLPESERAAAYSSLSRAAEETALGSTDPRPFYLSYFYAKRAQQIFARLPSTAVTDSDSMTADAYLMANVGVLLEYSGNSTGAPYTTYKWQCSWNAIEPMGSMTLDGHVQYGLVSHAYARLAGKYYRRALAILPQDATIACLAASNSFVLGNHQPMEDLANDASAHIQLAAEIVDKAESLPFRKLGTLPEANGSNLPLKDWPSLVYFDFALKEYESAISLAPDNIDALNGYAYTFWRWRMRDWTAKPPDGPNPMVAHRAEKYARDAAYLVAGNPSRKMQADVGSTLGEVLLGEGRPYEALQDLQSIGVGNYAVYNEIRWDTAMAYICKGGNDWQEHRISQKEYDEAMATAIGLLDKIAELEADREARPYSTAPHALDPRRPSSVCLSRPYQPESQESQGVRGPSIEAVPNPELFELADHKPSYESFPPCIWQGIDFMVAGAKGKDPSSQKMLAHIWGGGVDQRVEVLQGARSDHVLLPGAPKDTHDVYFAQLENAHGAPVSYVYSIDTFGELPGQGCPKNAITLKFTGVSR